MNTTTRHTTAASLHAAILRASLLCQAETRNQWEGLQGTRYAACKQFDAARAEASERNSARAWLECQAIDEAEGEWLETMARNETHIRFFHAHGSIKLANYAERLEQFAADMHATKKAWELWGGGAMPAHLAKPKKARAAYAPRVISVCQQLTEDGDHAGALDLALSALDGMVFQHGAKAFLLVAPQPVEGLPERLASGKNIDQGRWVVFCRVTGRALAGLDTMKIKTRAAVEQVARTKWAGLDEEQQQRVLSVRLIGEQPDALATWRKQYGINTQATPAAEAAPAADTTPAEATPATQATPAAEATPSALPATQDLLIAIATAAETLERCTNILGYDAARRAAIDAGRAGKIEAMEYIKAGLARYTTGNTGARWAVDALEQLRKAEAIEAAHGAAEAMAQATAAQAIDAAKTTAAAEGLADVATVETAANNAHHVSAAGQKCAQNEPEALEMAEELAEACATDATACATEATACATDGAPGVHTTRMDHAGTPGAPRAPRATMGQTSTTAGQASHSSHSSAQSLARADGQRIAGKSGKWSAVFYTAPGGRVAMTYTGTDGQPQAMDYATGSERMRALQTLARQADAASQPQASQPASQTTGQTASQPAGKNPAGQPDTGTHTPTQNAQPEQAQGQSGQPGAESGGVCAAQVPDYSDPLKTSAPDYSDPLKTSAGALQITITRAEGPSDECGISHTVGSFPEADALLAKWSGSVSAGGGYDKCDFLITWPDGDTYEGRYDLMHHSKERPSLADHMADMVDFYTGKGCPVHMSEAQYAGRMASVEPERRAAYEDVERRLNAAGVHTGHARPMAVDLRALVAAGLPVAGLVGLEVYHVGRMGDTAKGAIVEASDSGFYGLEVDVITEDGTLHGGIHAKDFGDKNGLSWKISTTRHGAPYLAQLAAAFATRKAQATAAQELQAKAHADELARLAVEFAHLERFDGKSGGGVFAARNIRTQLKRAFPGVKFSVKSSYSSIDIRWTDGPTDAQVSEVVGPFDIGAADTQSDYFYTVDSAFSELFGGVQYLNTHRDTSDAFTAQAMAEFWAEKFADVANAPALPTLEDWRNAAGFFDWRADDWQTRAFRTYLAAKAGPMPAPTKTTRKA